MTSKELMKKHPETREMVENVRKKSASHSSEEAIAILARQLVERGLLKETGRRSSEIAEELFINYFFGVPHYVV